MHFRINAISAGDGWAVTFADETGAPFPAQPHAQLASPRLLGALRDDNLPNGELAFPLPPADDPAPPGSPGAQLLDDQTELGVCYRRIAAQQPGHDDLERFGNYLFHTLIGSTIWQAMVDAAGGQPFELALCWGADDSSLARLPWEMLACSLDGKPAETSFLAARLPQVAITRRVPGHATLPAQLQSPPRVLFVVGTGLSEKEIRPGAEYLGLLRALESNDLRLRHQLLVQASPERLKAAIAAFKPSILHIICHGGISETGGRPYLELQSDGPEGKPKRIEAADLFAILAAGPAIEAVVLNACYTASAGDYSPVGQIALPLAVELVKGNGVVSVPIVVGMAGEVGDRACRLFTRRFYEALLSGGPLAQAVAHGRRLGLTNPDSDEWRSSLDWALPTMFLPASAGEATLTVMSSPDERLRQRQARLFRQGEYPAFCGREDHFDLYAALMGDDRLQRLTRPTSSQALLSGWGGTETFSALAIGAQFSNVYNENEQGVPKLGLTWLLGELAATAFRDGHLPIFFSISKKGKPQPYVAPKSYEELLRKLMEAAEDSTNRLGLHGPTCWKGLGECLRWKPNDPRPAVLAHDELASKESFNFKDPNDPDVLAAVFWLGVRGLCEALRQGASPSTRASARVLLLVDDVERMEKNTAIFLLTKLLSDDVLSADWFRDGVRVIVGYSVRGDEPAKAVYKDVILPWKDSPLIFAVPLGEFGEFEGFRAYRHFLFGWKRTKDSTDRQPLTFRKRRHEDVEPLLRFFQEEIIFGVPSYLAERGMSDVVKTLIWRKELIEAYDDALIQGQLPQQGPT